MQLLRHAVFENPYDTYRHLREADPVAWSDELNGWLVTRASSAFSCTVPRLRLLGPAARSLRGTVNLRPCGRSANHISLIGHTRPGESRRRTGENRPLIAQVTVPALALPIPT